MKLHTALLCTLTLALSTTACDLIKVKGMVRTTTVIDGKETTKEREFNSLEEMPAALKAGAGDMAETTETLAKKLTEAPPPGQVKLADLSPALAEFEQHPQFNFLAKAKNADGTPLEFKYVRIGVPTYDQFFQKSAELFALMYQLRQVTHRLREVSSTLLDKKDIDKDTSLGDLVKAAMAADGSGKEGMVKELKELKEITSMLAPAALAMVKKTQELVSSGQQLITGAPASITNPKTALHLDLIVKGLKQSVGVVAESGSLLKQVSEEIVALA